MVNGEVMATASARVSASASPSRLSRVWLLRLAWITRLVAPCGPLPHIKCPKVVREPSLA